MTMKRNGAIAVNGSGLATAFGEIDDMVYTYANNSNSNELIKIADTKWTGGAINQQLANNGFKDNQVASNDYTYDENGNITYDANKDVTITYNHLNLPTRFEWSVNQYIEITYDAAGVKGRGKK